MNSAFAEGSGGPATGLPTATLRRASAPIFAPGVGLPDTVLWPTPTGAGMEAI